MAEQAGRQRRMGLFGGSFDPVHRGHLALGQAALTQLSLDELRWIPTGHAWQKSRPLTDGVHRLAMLQEVVQGEPRFVVDDVELRRSGPSYMVDTVQALRDRHGEAAWFLIIGQDQYTNLHTWHEWRRLVGLVTLAVVARDGQRVEAPALAGVPHAVQVLQMPAVDVSATGIRRRIAAGEAPGALAPGLISPCTARYIADHALYGARTSPPPAGGATPRS